MATSSTTVLSVANLSLRLPDLAERRDAISELNLTIAPGETVCVVGESGSGKTMLALSVIGLLPRGVSARSGRISLGSVDLLSLDEAAMCDVRGRDIGMVFQEPMTSLNP